MKNSPVIESAKEQIISGLRVQLIKSYDEHNRNKRLIKDLAFKQQQMKKQISLIQNTIHYVKVK